MSEMWFHSQLQYTILARDRDQLREMVDHLMTCHPHHFLVLQDNNSIVGSELAVQCVAEKFGGDEGA